MNVLVVCQFYHPEPFNTADFCEGLIERGHSVTVVTSMPSYATPGNVIPPEYDGQNRVEETRNGVRVIRLRTLPRKTGGLNRIKNYFSFWHEANKEVARLDGEYDAVVGYQLSPVLQVAPAEKYARKHGKPMLLYSFDLWPASLTAGGFSEGSLPFRIMRTISRNIYAGADWIAVTSPLFDEYFKKELNLELPESLYLPQFADDFAPMAEVPVIDGFDASKVNLTFAGNVGAIQSVETIVDAAAQLRDDERILLHVVGDGINRAACEERAQELGLTNIVFHGRKPVEEMPAYYAASDAMLVTFQDSPMADYTLPRKVTTYLAAGKPVLAAARGETQRVVETAGCGYCCGYEDAEGLARIAREFASTPDKQIMGEAARGYYDKNFARNLFFDKVEAALDEMVKEQSHG